MNLLRAFVILVGTRLGLLAVVYIYSTTFHILPFLIMHSTYYEKPDIEWWVSAFQSVKLLFDSDATSSCIIITVSLMRPLLIILITLVGLVSSSCDTITLIVISSTCMGILSLLGLLYIA